jgi:hypothetical protein
MISWKSNKKLVLFCSCPCIEFYLLGRLPYWAFLYFWKRQEVIADEAHPKLRSYRRHQPNGKYSKSFAWLALQLTEQQ